MPLFLTPSYLQTQLTEPKVEGPHVRYFASAPGAQPSLLHYLPLLDIGVGGCLLECMLACSIFEAAIHERDKQC